MSGKSLTTINLFVYDTDVSENVLPTSPPPHTSNTFSSPNPIFLSYQQQHILKLGYITTLEPVTVTPIVFENQLQQQQKPQTPSPPPILSSPIPPSYLDVYAPQSNNPNEPPIKSPSRYSGDQESEGTPKGLFNFEPYHVVSDFDDEQYTNLPSLVIPNVYGTNFHPTITDVSIRYPSQPKPKEPNTGKILKNIESDSKSFLHTVIWTSVLSTNPIESYAAWEAYWR